MDLEIFQSGKLKKSTSFTLKKARGPYLQFGITGDLAKHFHRVDIGPLSKILAMYVREDICLPEDLKVL